MPVRETLLLDLSQALGQIDDLERELDALFQPIVIPVDIESDQSLAELQRDIRAVDNDDIDVDVNARGVSEAERSIERLADEFDDAEESAEDYARAVDRAEDETDKLGRTGKTAFSGLSKSLVGLAAAFGGIAALRGVADFFGESIQSASDLEESTSKAQVVFGEFFGDIQRFASTAPQALGLANSAALEFTGTFGNLFTALGLSQQAAADLAPDIVQLGSDLASFNNLEVTEALDKLRAGLVGEAEPLRALGVNLNAAAVEAKALELGLGGATGEVDDAAKVQARYALILEQTVTAQGDFARTSDGIANTQRSLSAEFENLRATIGTALLPAFADILAAGRDVIPVLEAAAPAVGFLAEAAVDAAQKFIPLADLLGLLVQPITDIAAAIDDIDTGDIDSSGLDSVSQSALDLSNNVEGVVSLIDELGTFLSSGLDAASIRSVFNSLGLAIEAGVDPLQAAGDALARFNEEGTITDEILAAVIDTTELTTSQIRALRESFLAGDFGFLTPSNLEDVDQALFNLTRGFDPADQALRTFITGLDDLPDATQTATVSLTDFGESLSRVVDQNLEFNIDEIRASLDELPSIFSGAASALRDEENEIIEDFDDFLDNFEEQVAAQSSFNRNVSLLESLGFDNLAQLFRDAGLDSAQALADGLNDPAALAEREASLDAAASRDALNYATAFGATVGQDLAALSPPEFEVTPVLGPLNTTGLDQAFFEVNVGSRAPGGGATTINQFFDNTPSPNTQTERAAQAANAIINSGGPQ